MIRFDLNSNYSHTSNHFVREFANYINLLDYFFTSHIDFRVDLASLTNPLSFEIFLENKIQFLSLSLSFPLSFSRIRANIIRNAVDARVVMI